MNSNTEQLVQIARRYLGLVILIITIVGSVFVAWRFVIPRVYEIRDLRAKIERDKTKQEDLANYASYLEKLADATLEVEEGLVNYAIPSENDVISLIVTYEGLSKTEGVTVSPFDVAPGAITTTEDTSVVPLSVVGSESDANTQTNSLLDGSGGQVLDQYGLMELPFKMHVQTEDPDRARAFISEIYQTRRVFTISQLSWVNPIVSDSLGSSSRSTSDANKLIQIDLSLSTYYYSHAPRGIGNADLVKKGREQTDFINNLMNTKVYDQLVLESVPTGKEDLFTLYSASGQQYYEPTPTPSPIPAQTEQEASSSSTQQTDTTSASPNAGISPDFVF